MSIQPRKPMLLALREALRKLERSATPEAAEQAELKRMMRQRIARIEVMEQRSDKRSGR